MLSEQVSPALESTALGVKDKAIELTGTIQVESTCWNCTLRTAYISVSSSEIQEYTGNTDKVIQTR